MAAATSSVCDIDRFCPSAVDTTGKKLLFAIAIIVALGSIACFVTGILLPPQLDRLSLGMLIAGGATFFASAVAIQRLRQGTRLVRDGGPLPFRVDRDTPDTMYAFMRRKVRVTVVQEWIRQAPEVHLREFVQQLDRMAQFENGTAIRVTFLIEDGRGGFLKALGEDAGGLTRDYLDDLVGGTLRSEQLNCQIIESSSLVVPLAPQDDQNAFTTCMHLGKVIMCSYPMYTIGCHFDPSVFSVAFQLSAQELDAPFSALPLPQKCQLYRALLAAQNNRDLDTLLLLVSTPAWSSAQQAAARGLAGHLGLTDSSHEALAANLSERLDPQVRAIHALAQGMKSVCVRGERAIEKTRTGAWNAQYRGSDFHSFISRLQGSIDRDRIADSFTIMPDHGNRVIEEKVGWLKRWIRTEATVTEIRQFLKFVTGSTGLCSGQQIFVARSRHRNVPFPSAQTCTPQIDLAPTQTRSIEMNDHTYEGFIACVKVVTTGDGAGFSLI